MTRTLHSSLRLTSHQVLRQDVGSKARVDMMMYQFNILDALGNLVHHDAITGTSPGFVMGDFNDRALEFKNQVYDMTSKLLIDKLREHHNLNVTSLKGSMDYWQTHTKLTSPYSHYGELLVAVQNPSAQERDELVELQLPYYNYTIHQVINGTEHEIKEFDKFLPRTWYNSNRTIVKSYCQFPVNFEARELSKAFVIRNLGVLRKKNHPPAEYKGDPERVWNLNLPLFLQKEGWEIDVFQSNYRRGVRPGSMIKAGNKTLKFVQVVKRAPVAKGSAAQSDAGVAGVQERADNKEDSSFSARRSHAPNATER